MPRPASLFLATTVAVAGLFAASAAAGASTFGFFKTPSGNVQCLYNYSTGAAARSSIVTCGITSGLKPPPHRRGPRCSVPNRVTLGVTGRPHTARSICPGEDEGDAGPFAGGSAARTLAYGKTWHGGGLTCTSAVKGLTCRNPAGHGFFLSRAHWRSF
jgi:hypothetical protein